jgi:hypothetical protein
MCSAVGVYTLNKSCTITSETGFNYISKCERLESVPATDKVMGEGDGGGRGGGSGEEGEITGE